MAGQLGGNDSDGIVDINITPLVDIILVVLIIFMVTATYIVAPSIKVALPEAATGEATESTSLGIHLNVEGTLFLDGEEIEEATLRASIQDQLAMDPELVCLIAADKDVTHGKVVWLMDLVRQEGVGRFYINIDPAVAEPPGE